MAKKKKSETKIDAKRVAAIVGGLVLLGAGGFYMLSSVALTHWGSYFMIYRVAAETNPARFVEFLLFDIAWYVMLGLSIFVGIKLLMRKKIPATLSIVLVALVVTYFMRMGSRILGSQLCEAIETDIGHGLRGSGLVGSAPCIDVVLNRVTGIVFFNLAVWTAGIVVAALVYRAGKKGKEKKSK